jgi:hypothetical protein
MLGEEDEVSCVSAGRYMEDIPAQAVVEIGPEDAGFAVEILLVRDDPRIALISFVPPTA